MSCWCSCSVQGVFAIMRQSNLVRACCVADFVCSMDAHHHAECNLCCLRVQPLLYLDVEEEQVPYGIYQSPRHIQLLHRYR